MAGENENQPGGQPAELPALTDEEALQPLEIDLNGEDGVETEPAAAAEPVAAVDPAAEPKPKEPKRKQESIPKLRQRAQSAEARATESETTAQRLARENEQLRQQNAQSDKAAMTHYKTSIEREADLAQRELRDAIASGDPDVQAKAQEAVASVQAKKVSIDQWEAAQPKEQPKPAPQPRQPQRQAEVPLDPETATFIADNPWFNHKSDEFDQDMAQFTVAEATKIENRYRRQGRDGEIGSKKYFEDVMGTVRQEFPEYFGEEEPAPAPEPPVRGIPAMGRASGVVAPAGRTAPGAPVSPATRITLSAEERTMARQLASNGAITNSDGSRMTQAQAEKAYAIQKYKNRSAQ